MIFTIRTIFLALVLYYISLGQALSQKQWSYPTKGYVYQFPKDHGSHPNYKIEWWYITGHVKGDDNDYIGFESTFFRIGQKEESDIHLAHMAITDIKRQNFYHEERLNKEGWNAYSKTGDLDLKNGNWTLKRSKDNEFFLNFSVKSDFLINLKLTPQKPLVIFGEDGISKKGPSKTAASHYITFSRLGVSGTILSDKKELKVTGNAWMDHEISSSQLDENQVGWDWVSVQLNDNREVMAYILRTKDGSISDFSKLVWISEDGELTHQTPDEFQWIQNGNYKSSETGAVYPISPSFTTKDPKSGTIRKFTVIPLMEEQEKSNYEENFPEYLDWSNAFEVLEKAHEQGIFVLVIGPKGTGKTTLVREFAKKKSMKLRS